MQQTVWIDVGENAELKHSRNALDDCERHWQYLNVRLQPSAQYLFEQSRFRQRLRRQDIHLILDGEGSEATLVSAGRVGRQGALISR